MAEELHLLSDQVQEVPRSSMTIETALSDGTTINLAVSPASTASSAVTASTTFTHTSFSFHISTSLPIHALSSRKSSPPPEFHPSPISSPSEEYSKPTSIPSPPIQYLKPSKMVASLPEDVVAINTGKKNLLFYVYANKDGDNELSYLESPNEHGNGNFVMKKIKAARNPFKNDEDEVIVVSPNNKQVAAVTWVGPQGIEIRVYYVKKGDERIREVCKTGDAGWEVGALSVKGNPYRVSHGTSISASVHYYQSKGSYNLRVFAARDGVDGTNENGVAQITSFKFMNDGSPEDATWQGNFITDAITKY
ncbi:hypothetical protein FMEXI_13627 [Fusarium mexicanum]|uniref:Fucose-specific lectin n=1 Tax=Fusarium mexicanum TaxID=751941 RepID=A0A8H5I686_9HYPO|nr:hypothetical protein FMEXI_13627 [Fusarium mexicanum]